MKVTKLKKEIENEIKLLTVSWHNLVSLSTKDQIFNKIEQDNQLVAQIEGRQEALRWVYVKLNTINK
jgi:hypothetical protein